MRISILISGFKGLNSNKGLPFALLALKLLKCVLYQVISLVKPPKNVLCNAVENNTGFVSPILVKSPSIDLLVTPCKITRTKENFAEKFARNLKLLLAQKSINKLLSFRQLQNTVMYVAEAIMRLLFTPKLTKEKCRQSYNLAKNVLRRITKITIFSSHPGKNENCHQNNDRSPPHALSYPMLFTVTWELYKLI